MSRKSNRRRHRRRQEHQRSTSKTLERSPSPVDSCLLCQLESIGNAHLSSGAPRLGTASEIVAFGTVASVLGDRFRMLLVVDDDGDVVDLVRCVDGASPEEIGDVAWSRFGLLPPGLLLVIVLVEWGRSSDRLGATSDAHLAEVSDLFKQVMIVETNGRQSHVTSVTARHDPWDVAGVDADAVFDGFAGLFGGDAQGAAGRSGSVDHPDQEPT